jgi:hypothetical protein
MKTISFVWDVTKAESNLKKHKISFEEAQTVFSDPDARMIFDPEHSGDEDRVIRIISARKANKSEQKQYGSFLL